MRKESCHRGRIDISALETRVDYVAGISDEYVSSVEAVVQPAIAKAVVRARPLSVKQPMIKLVSLFDFVEPPVVFMTEVPPQSLP